MIAIMSLLFLVHRWSTVTDEKISNVVTCVHVLSGSGKSRTAAGLCAKALPDITVGYIYVLPLHALLPICHLTKSRLGRSACLIQVRT